MTNRQLSIYCSFIFFVSWTIQILTIFITKDINSNNASLRIALTMVSPLIVTIECKVLKTNARQQSLLHSVRFLKMNVTFLKENYVQTNTIC